jgi:polar amino acid transport system substrate-binding protein
MKRGCFIFMVLFFAVNIASPAVLPAQGAQSDKELLLCCDERDLYPFTYMLGDEAAGMYIDIVKEAASRCGYELKIKMYPLKRCIRMAEHSEVDGIISVVYDRQNAPYFEYPPNTPNIKESEWAIMQVDEVLVTPIESDYEFTGKIRSLPAPVRVTEGVSIAPYLRQAGLTVEESSADRQNLTKLVRDKTGSAVMSSVTAERLFQDEAFKGKIKISSSPLKSESYFLVFSWGSRLSPQERRKLWDEIAKVRKDYIFMMGAFSQY